MPIRAIIVDFYDVLYGEQGSARLRDFDAEHGLPEGGLRQMMSLSTYFNAALPDSVSGEVLWRDIAVRIGVDPNEWQTLIDIYRSAFGFNAGLVAFLQELRPRYLIGLLSNTTPHVRELITQQLRPDNLFDDIVLSAEEGVKKPDEEFYCRLLRRLQVQPQESIFVDDDISYVASAQALGMYGVLFSNTKQTIADVRGLLARFGLEE